MNEAEVVYAKVIHAGAKASDDAWRVETKHAEDLDDWPTDQGTHTIGEAVALISENDWVHVNSWQEALKLEGWTKPWPRTTLFAPAN